MVPSKPGNFQSQKATEAIRQGGLKGQGMGEGILKESGGPTISLTIP